MSAAEMRRCEEVAASVALSGKRSATAARKAWQGEEDALRAAWEVKAAEADATEAAAPAAEAAAASASAAAAAPAAEAAAASASAAYAAVPAVAVESSSIDVEALRLAGNERFKAGDAKGASELYEQVCWSWREREGYRQAAQLRLLSRADVQWGRGRRVHPCRLI
jgi:hypothetical protein